jgi:hypothetical protein
MKQRSTHHKEGKDLVNRNKERRGRRMQKKPDGSESELGEGISQEIWKINII